MYCGNVAIDASKCPLEWPPSLGGTRGTEGGGRVSVLMMRDGHLGRDSLVLQRDGGIARLSIHLTGQTEVGASGRGRVARISKSISTIRSKQKHASKFTERAPIRRVCTLNWRQDSPFCLERGARLESTGLTFSSHQKKLSAPEAFGQAPRIPSLWPTSKASARLL